MLKSPKKSKPKERTKSSVKPGSIIKTNDYTLTKYYKPNRRLVVNKTTHDYMNLSKIHSIKGKEDKVRSGRLIPLKDKYESLPEPSAVSVYYIYRDANGKRFKTTDKRFVITGENLTPEDMAQIKKGRKEYYKNKGKRR